MNIRLTDRKRASIVEAAVEGFSRRGFYATSMNHIADLANVSKRTLYKHFDSKEALFEAIVDEMIDRSDSVPYEDYDPESDLTEQLIALARAEIDLMASGPIQNLARAGLSRVIAEPEVAKSINHKRFLRHIVRWLKQAKAAGELTEMSDVQLAAWQFTGLLKSFAFWPPLIRGEARLTPRRRNKVAKETAQMFLARYQ
ncbi:TetR/AcrR family transcriptional regulator [Mariniblastus fucicola]|uniref:TetR/AcrR family transcriptional regulator n=1 Tax=Mariniblastus fucicola TaxID=980251 RepID=UPI0009468299|nr:TetR/AcrR family transcriptional regulator [Mariniblastus fucicola]